MFVQKKVLSLILTMAIFLTVFAGMGFVEVFAGPANPYSLSYTFTNTLPAKEVIIGDSGLGFNTGGSGAQPAKSVLIGPEGDKRWAFTPGPFSDRCSLLVRVHDGFYPRGSGEEVNIRLTVEYYGGDAAYAPGDSPFVLYTTNSGLGGWGMHTKFSVNGDKTWKTATFDLNNAVPNGSQWWGDIEIGCWNGSGQGYEKLYIHKITVERDAPGPVVTPAPTGKKTLSYTFDGTLPGTYPAFAGDSGLAFVYGSMDDRVSKVVQVGPAGDKRWAFTPGHFSDRASLLVRVSDDFYTRGGPAADMKLIIEYYDGDAALSPFVRYDVADNKTDWGPGFTVGGTGVWKTAALNLNGAAPHGGFHSCDIEIGAWENGSRNGYEKLYISKITIEREGEEPVVTPPPTGKKTLSYTFTSALPNAYPAFAGDSGLAFVFGSMDDRVSKVMQVGPAGDKRWAFTPGHFSDRVSLLVRVSDDFYTRGGPAADMRLIIEYYDGDTALAPFVRYDVADNKTDWGPGFTVGGTGVWKTATLNLNGADPHGGFHSCDIEIGTWENGSRNGYEKLYISKITVEREEEVAPPTPVPAKFSVYNVYGSNMIFQAGKPVNIDGTSQAGSTVTASLTDGVNTYTASASAGSDNKYRVTFDEVFDPGYTQYNLTVNSTMAGAAAKTFSSIVFGDVYLMAGQSNMEHPFNRYGVVPGAYDNQLDPELKAYYDSITADEFLRFYAIDEGSSGGASSTPRDNFYKDIAWKKLGGKSDMRWIPAAAGVFAMELSKEVDYPIGFIPAAIGATGITQWFKGGNCFNGNIQPFKPFSFKGVLWYQGENEQGSYNNPDYMSQQIRVINDFREMFNDPELPFCITQLANYTVQDFRGVREKQLDTFKHYEEKAKAEGRKNVVGLISIVDQVYDRPDDIHPSGKTELGKRFVTWALSVIYDRQPEYSGPIPLYAYKNENEDIAIKFSHVGGGGLKSKDGTAQVGGFEVVTANAPNGTDGEYFQISGRDTVIISMDDASDGVLAIQYAYEKNNTNATLMNSVGLAAPAFAPIPILDHEPDGISEVQLQDLSGEATYSIVPEGKVRRVTVRSGNYAAGTVVVAAYSKGVLTGTKLLPLTEDDYRDETPGGDNSHLAYVYANWTIPANTDSIKIFFWNSDTIAPFVEMYEI